MGSFNLEMLLDPLNNEENIFFKNGVPKETSWKRSKDNSLDNGQEKYHNNSI